MTGDGFDPQIIKAAYASVADDYAGKFGDDLGELPLDRSLLDVVAERCRDRGSVLDLGCGPAHLAEYLTKRGAGCVGIDFTPAMLLVARQRVAGLPVAAGDVDAPLRAPRPAIFVRLGGSCPYESHERRTNARSSRHQDTLGCAARAPRKDGGSRRLR